MKQKQKIEIIKKQAEIIELKDIMTEMKNLLESFTIRCELPGQHGSVFEHSIDL